MTLDIDQIVQKIQSNQKVIKVGVQGCFQLYSQFMKYFDKSPSNGDIVNIKTFRFQKKNKNFIIQFVFQDDDIILEQFREEINQGMDCMVVFASKSQQINRFEKFFSYNQSCNKILICDFCTDDTKIKDNDVHLHTLDLKEEQKMNKLISKICNINQNILQVDLL